MESINDDHANGIKLEDSQQLKWWMHISFYWKEEPADDILSVILLCPAGECKLSLLKFRLIYLNSMFHHIFMPQSLLPSMENKLFDKSEEIFEDRWIASESMSAMDPLTRRCRSAAS